MKITKELIKQFEDDQAEWGTATAISNVLWQNADEQLKDLGISETSTKYQDEKKFNKLNKI